MFYYVSLKKGEETKTHGRHCSERSHHTQKAPILYFEAAHVPEIKRILLQLKNQVVKLGGEAWV
jgi:hypothetical protein